MEKITSNEITLDFKNFCVIIDGESRDIQYRTFNVLKYFMLNPNRPISRQELYRNCWENDVIIGERTVDVQICFIRRLLKDKSKLKARCKFGYVWKDNS